MRVVINCFQYSTEIVQWRVCRVLRAVHEFENIIIKLDENAHELPHELDVNEKYYPWFKI